MLTFSVTHSSSHEDDCDETCTEKKKRFEMEAKWEADA